MRASPEALRKLMMPVPLAEAELASKPVSAVLVLLRPDREDLEVLLGRRARRPGDPWSGQVSFPGGHRHKEDPSLLETALRETKEEMNLDLAGRAEVVGHLAPRSPGNVPEMLVVPFVAVATQPLAPHAGPEMAEAFWTPLRELPRCREQATVQTRVGELRVPAYRWKGRLIWGLTYRILEELLILLDVSG